VPFSTIQLIAEELNNVDFIINVALGTDANRNLLEAVKKESFEKAREKYGSFLGNPEFFQKEEVLKATAQNNRQELRKLFADEYKKQLENIGFQYTDRRLVKHYYYLLFASKHKLGLEFWNRACRYAPDGQKELFTGI
jgi:three-Cys-motif partner protein